MPAASESSPARKLGRTGARVLAIYLGCEGILRTTGRARDAVPVIVEALRLGVRYCDTAPAYAQSQDYYGAAFREAGPARVPRSSSRPRRTNAPATPPCACSTIRCAAWGRRGSTSGGRCTICAQPLSEVDALFAKGGAIQAALEAKADGRVRHIGLTGHHDPQVLLDAMSRFAFDSVLVPINPADARHSPFIPTVVAEARRQGMGVVGMKALAAGRLLDVARPEELLRHKASIADTAIVGCSSLAEVRQNLAVANAFTPMCEAKRDELETRVAPRARAYDYYKAGP